MDGLLIKSLNPWWLDVGKGRDTEQFYLSHIIMSGYSLTVEQAV